MDPAPELKTPLRRTPEVIVYRECMRNHAAALGGHAVDGCGEFMPSQSSLLSCAACGCHRNFHHRLSTSATPGQSSSGDDEEPHHPSAPHMLMALSAVAVPKKRFRTKFSPEQKERMLSLSERLGWRMQRKDDMVIEQSCREIGVDKSVFKVWMHNNKHHFYEASRRAGELATAAVGSMMGSMTSPNLEFTLIKAWHYQLEELLFTGIRAPTAKGTKNGLPGFKEEKKPHQQDSIRMCSSQTRACHKPCKALSAVTQLEAYPAWPCFAKHGRALLQHGRASIQHGRAQAQHGRAHINTPPCSITKPSRRPATLI